MSRPEPSLILVPARNFHRPGLLWRSSLALALGLLSACSGAEPEASNTDAGTGLTGIVSFTDGSSTTGTDPDATSQPTTGIDSDSSTDSGPKQDMFVCQKVMVEIPIVTPSVMLVLDKSGSMVAEGSGYWDHDNDPNTPTVTRWSSLHSVVDFIVTSFNEKMNLGAALFPSTTALSKYTVAACPVNPAPEVKVAPLNAATILAAIPGADSLDLRGGTPATAGITTAVGELQSIVDGQPQFIVLVTDGAANCASDAATASELFEQYDVHLPEVVAQANADEIPTFVVGIDIKDVISPTIQDGNPDATNTYEKLNELAVAGGKPRDGAEKFYNTSNQIELMAALEAITEQILSCTFTLTPPPTDMQFVNEVIVGLQQYGIDQVENCLTEDGWHFVDAEKTQIELCGAACATFKMTGVVDVHYDCLQL